GVKRVQGSGQPPQLLGVDLRRPGVDGGQKDVVGVGGRVRVVYDPAVEALQVALGNGAVPDGVEDLEKLVVLLAKPLGQLHPDDVHAGQAMGAEEIRAGIVGAEELFFVRADDGRQ